MLKKYFILVVVFCFTSTTFAQKVWEKPYDNWSKKEAFKVLTLSPWAQTFRSTMLNTNDFGNNPVVGKTSNNETFVATKSRFPVVIRLNSALPVRQAMVRLKKIEIGYDEFNSKQQATFDAKAKNFLDCSTCDDYHIVSVSKYFDKSPRSNTYSFFQSQELKDLQGKIRLVSNDGSERELTKFIAPKKKSDSAVFYFKRKDSEGKMFVSSKTKSFKFVFGDILLEADTISKSMFPQNFDFKVSSLIVDNKVQF